MSPHASMLAYAATLALLFALQAAQTLAGLDQIRWEELAESVRSVYWLEERSIYVGMGTNIGWYGLLLLVYRTLGFTLATAAYAKLALSAVSLLALGSLCRRYAGPRAGIVALLAIGLSPTLLYWNALRLPVGMDLVFAPILLWLVAPEAAGRARLILASALAMVASLAYPTALLLVPAVAVLVALRLRSRAEAGACVAAFLLPLALGLALVEDPRTFIHDPVTGTGVFRAGGGLRLEPGALASSIGATVRDLFVRGESYYFELRLPDFRGEAGGLAVAFVLAAGAALLVADRAARLPVALALGTIVLGLSVPNLSAHLPGVRRSTAALAGFYALFAIVLGRLARDGPPAPAPAPAFPRLRLAGLSVLLALPIQHALAYPQNLADLGRPSIYRQRNFFTDRPTAALSLESWLEATGRGETVRILDGSGRPRAAPYAEIFAALAGYRVWNGLPEVPILAHDAKYDRPIRLSKELWDTGYLPP